MNSPSNDDCPSNDDFIGRIAARTTINENASGTITSRDIDAPEEFQHLTEEQQTQVLRRVESIRSLSRPVDAEDLARRLREGFTPEPESPEERDASLRIFESEARKLLVKDGCPPCHPADLPCPLREPDIPEHLKDILKYFDSSSNSSGFLNSQLHKWREFRQYQAWERQRYGPRKFHRYVERLHECLQEHQIGCDADAVNLRLDAREQGPFDNWIEYQYRQLVCLGIFERKRDEAAAAEELRGPQQFLGSGLTKLELATRNLETHKLLLPWIQQERRAMEENPQLLAAQPNVRSDDEGADDDEDDLDEVVREYAAVQKEEGRVAFLKETVLWARNSMKPYRRPRHANTDGQQGDSLPAVEGATGATSVRDGEPDSTAERDNVPPAETTDEGPAASEAGQTPLSRGQDGDAAAPSADDRNKSPVTQNAEEAPGETGSHQTADGRDEQAAVPLVEDTQSSRRQTRAATTKSRNRRRQQDEQTAAPVAPTPAVAPARTTQSSRRRTRAATTKSRKRGRQQDEDEEAEEAAEQDNPAPAKKKRAKATTKRAAPRRRQQEIAPVPVAVPPARKEVRTRSGRISRPPERWVPTF